MVRVQALFRRWGNNRHPPGWGGGVGWNRGCWCAREPDGGGGGGSSGGGWIVAAGGWRSLCWLA